MLWWFVRYKTIPLLKLMAAIAHIMGTPEIASFDSIPLQGELIQPPPVPRKALSSGRVCTEMRGKVGWSVGCLEVLLRDLGPHHAARIRSASRETTAARRRGRTRSPHEHQECPSHRVVKLGETEQ